MPTHTRAQPSSYNKLYLILWKNFKIRQRNPLRTVIEICWPVSLFTIIALIRSLSEESIVETCHYNAYAMPSAGLVPWFQSIICNINSPCLKEQSKTEKFGQVSDFPKRFSDSD